MLLTVVSGKFFRFVHKTWYQNVSVCLIVLQRIIHCSRKRWKIPPIKVVQYLHLYGGIFPPSASGWKNSTMLYPPFWWNFSTCLYMVENYFHLLVYGGNIFHLLADGGKISTKKGGMFPPASRWWKFFSTCLYMVEIFSTCLQMVEKLPPKRVECFHLLPDGGNFSHLLVDGGKIFHLLADGGKISTKKVEFSHHQKGGGKFHHIISTFFCGIIHHL